MSAAGIRAQCCTYGDQSTPIGQIENNVKPYVLGKGSKLKPELTGI